MYNCRTNWCPLEFFKIGSSNRLCTKFRDNYYAYYNPNMYAWVVCIIVIFKLRIKDNYFQFFKIRVDTN